MTERISYTPEAQRQLDDLDNWITANAGPEISQQFISAIIDHIEGIPAFPGAGRNRDDVRPGVKTTSFRRRTLIAYEVVGCATDLTVIVLGIFHRGPDWETALREKE